MKRLAILLLASGLLAGCFHRQEAQIVGNPNLETGGKQEEKLATLSTQTSGEMTVIYTEAGFSPKEIKVGSGTTITFINQSSKEMWVASDMHPTHEELAGFDQLKSAGKGGVYSFKFVKPGSWGYHNHLAPAQRGVVEVEQGQ